MFTGAAKAVAPKTFEVHGFETWMDLALEPGQPHVRTVSLRIPVPEVILLTRYSGVPNQRVTFTRRNLYRRDNSTCQYCGSRPGNQELSIDHVVPRSLGGKSSWENCALACLDCNRRKANRMPADAGMQLAKVPRAPRWTPAIEAPIARVRSSWEKFVSEAYWNIELRK